jgi:hypothetical protein
VNREAEREEELAPWVVQACSGDPLPEPGGLKTPFQLV